MAIIMGDSFTGRQLGRALSARIISAWILDASRRKRVRFSARFEAAPSRRKVIQRHASDRAVNNRLQLHIHSGECVTFDL